MDHAQIADCSELQSVVGALHCQHNHPIGTRCKQIKVNVIVG